MYKLFILLSSIFLVVIKCDETYKKCGDSIECMDQEMVKFIDKLEKEESLPVIGNVVRLVKSGNAQSSRSDEGVVERCIRYFSNHELRIGIPTRTARNLVDEARTKKIRRIILPLLLLLKLKAAVVIPAVLSAIALVAFKGLGAGLAALALAGTLAFKNTLENSSSKVTYEVIPQVAPPHWSRAGVDPLPQAQGYHTII